MVRTREDGNGAVLYRNERVLWIVRDEMTAGAVDTAGRAVREEFSGILCGESTDGGELLEMVVTANEGECKLIQKEKGNRVIVL
ncbi:hypothetical protein [Halococcus thailandensis]|uniref:Uncharacterized protein n=1 Tax=Halococcus thailandensis JCM 13552 TaxID=1227457 RepID=M0NAX3_9EURY|nr:hypothetical protein [Halococcus thailandensis]EMA54723.1 hypothetical protein C451_06070 [Halococcus thailandensis JCM 13552]